MSRQRYDLVVIGAGAGGSAAAVYAARAGARTALIDLSADCLGGGSVNGSDLPSKVFALACQQPAANWRQACRAARQAAERSRQELLRTWSQMPSLDLIYGRASLNRRGGVIVEGGERLESRRIIVATGSEPAIPSITGLKTAGYETVESFLMQPRRKPARTVILGGGPSAVELASALARLKIRTHLIEHNPHILMGIDEETAEFLSAKLESAGVTVLSSSSLVMSEAAGQNGRLRLVVQSRSRQLSLNADVLIVAAGRRPRLPWGLKSNGVSVKNEGIAVDGNWRTANPRIYAVGDVVAGGGARLSHSAAWAGWQASRHALFGLKAFAPKWQPQCIYCDPPVATVGVTVQQLIQEGLPHDVITSTYGAPGPLNCFGGEGFVKAIVNHKRKLVGAVCVGWAAGETIGYLALAVERGLSIEQLRSLPLPYPSASAALHGLAAEAEMSGSERFGRLARLRLILQ